MATQSKVNQPHTPFLVYYEERGDYKKFELTAWAKRRLMPNPPITERIRRKAVEKWGKLKTLLPKH